MVKKKAKTAKFNPKIEVTLSDLIDKGLKERNAVAKNTSEEPKWVSSEIFPVFQ